MASKSDLFGTAFDENRNFEVALGGSLSVAMTGGVENKSKINF